MASSFEEAPNYFEEALGILKLRAGAEGLIVDHDATEAVRSLLGTAIARAEASEGPDAFSTVHQAQFVQTATLLAREATDAAQLEHNSYVNHMHIEQAIEKLQALDFWPFTGD
jgi:hypothetical protein